MEDAAVRAALGAVACLVLAGCLGGVVHPGPSLGPWTTTDAEPWLAYVRNAGFCGPVCYAGAFVFTDARAVWITWGPDYDMGGAPTPATSGSDPAMRPEEEPYRPTVEKALRFLGGPLDQRVYNVVTATMPDDDHGDIRGRLTRLADASGTPPPLLSHCEDAGSVDVVLQAADRWDVDLPGHYGSPACYTFDGNAGHWPRIDRQGSAVWQWLEQPRWTGTHQTDPA